MPWLQGTARQAQARVLTLYKSSTSALLIRFVSGWLLLLWLPAPHGLLLLAGPL
jgi:hypothetical protein